LHTNRCGADLEVCPTVLLWIHLKPKARNAKILLLGVRMVKTHPFKLGILLKKGIESACLLIQGCHIALS